MEPVNVTAPMKTAKPTSPMWKPLLASSEPGCTRNELKPTSTAAMPTNECSIATSSGMPVMGIVNAFRAPIAPPITSAMAMSPTVTTFTPLACQTAMAMVATSARAMPTMPNVLPRKAVFCWDKPASARMNRSAARI